MIPPYTVDKLPPWVCAFIVHPNECKGRWNTKAVSAVAINENGELLDSKTFNTIMMPWAAELNAAEYNDDYQSLKTLITRYWVQLLVIGANCLQANFFWNTLGQIAEEIL